MLKQTIDLESFLVNEYFQTYARIPWAKDITEASFLATLQEHEKKYQSHKFLVDSMDRFFSVLYRWGRLRSKKKILFQESKYGHLVLVAKKHYQVRLLVQGKRDRWFAFRHGFGYLSSREFDTLVLKYLQEKKVRYLEELVRGLEEKLAIVKPDYIVLTYDVFPVERAIILAAKNLGIPTIVVQHAIYDLPTPLTDLKAAEYVLAWGQYFKEYAVNQQGRESQQIYVLGYPYAIAQLPDRSHVTPKRVCYLGQDFQRHSAELLPVKLETIVALDRICREIGFDFVYRNHYAEDPLVLQSLLPGIKFTPPNQPLEQTFQEADIFISFSSTSLVEAAMRGKLCVQLRNYPIDTDNFETLGASTKSFQTLPEIEGWLQGAGKASSLDQYKKEFNNDYIAINKNPEKRFLEIIQEIGKRHYGS